LNPEDFISIARQGLELTIMLSMPLLVSALVTGAVNSVKFGVYDSTGAAVMRFLSATVSGDWLVG
jgi:hypothetical protein